MLVHGKIIFGLFRIPMLIADDILSIKYTVYHCILSVTYLVWSELQLLVLFLLFGELWSYSRTVSHKPWSVWCYYGYYALGYLLFSEINRDDGTPLKGICWFQAQNITNSQHFLHLFLSFSSLSPCIHYTTQVEIMKRSPPYCMIFLRDREAI